MTHYPGMTFSTARNLLVDRFLCTLLELLVMCSFVYMVLDILLSPLQLWQES